MDLSVNRLIRHEGFHRVLSWIGREGILLLLLVFFVLGFTAIVNMWPGERFMEWDLFWHDILRAGRLLKLRESLLWGEWNALDPFVGLGYNILGETTLRESPLSPFSLLTLFVDARTIIFLRWLALFIFFLVGSYYYFRRFYVSRSTAFVGTLLLGALPIHSSHALYANLLDMLYCLPVFLFVTERALTGQVKWIVAFALLTFFITAIGDVYVFLIFPPIILINPGAFLCFRRDSSFRFRLLLMRNIFILLAIFMAMSSHYLIPLARNIREIGSVASEFKLLIDFRTFEQYWNFLNREFLPSALTPLDGSQAYLYAPFSIMLIAAWSLLLVWRREFRSCRRITFTFFGLIAVAFFIAILFYLVPALARSGRGTLRYHLNVFPILITFCAVIAAAVMTRFRGGRFQLGILILGGLVWDIYWFLMSDQSNEQLFRLWPAPHIFLAPNRLGVSPWHLFPWVNFMGCMLVLVSRMLPIRANKFLYIAAITVALLAVAVKKDTANWSHLWSAHFRSSVRWNHYLKRWNCIENLIDMRDPNYRVFPAGSPQSGLSDVTARNWKLIAEPEAAAGTPTKFVFNHRENTHGYEAVIYSAIAGFSEVRPSHFQPPIIENALQRRDLLKLLGVKYVLSADRKIEAKDLLFRGECATDWPKDYPLPSEFDYVKDTGVVYVYEDVAPQGVAFLVDEHPSLEPLAWKGLILSTHIEKKKPWESLISTAEKDSARVTVATSSSLDIEVNSSRERVLVVSHLFRKGWQARIDGVKGVVFPAFGGMLGLKVPAGTHLVRLDYYALDFYVGLIISLLTISFLVVALIHKVRRNLATRQTGMLKC